MKIRTIPTLCMTSAAMAVALTGFYFVHESLPRAIRAPTSLLLAPIAVVDGACYAIGVRGIYGRLAPVLLVNWMSSLLVCWVLLTVKRWWSKRKTRPRAEPARSASAGPS